MRHVEAYVAAASVSAALAALLLASIWRAFIGPPASRPRCAASRAMLGALAASGACYLAGAAFVVLADAPLPGALVVVAGIEASCLGAWLVRGGEGWRDDDGRRDDGPDPSDWDAFDRARADWARRRPGRASV